VRHPDAVDEVNSDLILPCSTLCAQLYANSEPLGWVTIERVPGPEVIGTTMKFLPLVWYGIWRKPVRTALISFS
jgi:hypothetical protein